jgi:hypothetical protein
VPRQSDLGDDLVAFLAESAEELEDAAEMIRASDLELVACVAIAQPLGHPPVDLLLVFGEPPDSSTGESAERDAAA